MKGPEKVRIDQKEDGQDQKEHVTGTFDRTDLTGTKRLRDRYVSLEGHRHRDPYTKESGEDRRICWAPKGHQQTDLLCRKSLISKHLGTHLQSAKKKNPNVPNLQHRLHARMGLCLSSNSSQRFRQPIQRTNVSVMANAAM